MLCQLSHRGPVSDVSGTSSPASDLRFFGLALIMAFAEAIHLMAEAVESQNDLGALGLMENSAPVEIPLETAPRAEWNGKFWAAEGLGAHHLSVGIIEIWCLDHSVQSSGVFCSGGLTSTLSFASWGTFHRHSHLKYHVQTGHFTANSHISNRTCGRTIFSGSWWTTIFHFPSWQLQSATCGKVLLLLKNRPEKMAWSTARVAR